METKLQKKILEDPGSGPAIPDLMQDPILPGQHSRERGGACDPCKAQNCGKCRGCMEEELISTGLRNQGTAAPESCEADQRRCATGPKSHPPTPSPWGASSTVSEATADNLITGLEELMSQRDRVMETAVWLLPAVSEAGGVPWEANLGLTARALTASMGEQENRVMN